MIDGRVARSDVFAFRLPVRTDFRTSRGVVAGTSGGRTIILVRLEAENGVAGWGEASPIPTWSPETVSSVVGILQQHFLPASIGCSCTDLDGLHRKLDQLLAPLWGLSAPIARAGIDIAMYDLFGRLLGLPLAVLLGSQRRQSIQLSWTVTGSTPDVVASSLRAACERGFRSGNIKLGGAPSWDLELCRLAREAFPSGFLWGDANGGLPLASARERALALQAAGLDLLEQPLPPDRLAATADLTARLHIPVALDEPITSPAVLWELIQQRCLTALALKVTRTGGLLPSRRCVDLAEAAGLLLISSGLTDAGVAFAANVQLAAAYGIDLPCALNGPQ
ncbi:MAG: hypothetical protein M1298_01615, partial [Chloroflexi bacterium]|nr:hypothetical protein [Chloroflexota bacterium]